MSHPDAEFVIMINPSSFKKHHICTSNPWLSDPCSANDTGMSHWKFHVQSIKNSLRWPWLPSLACGSWSQCLDPWTQRGSHVNYSLQIFNNVHRWGIPTDKLSHNYLLLKCVCSSSGLSKIAHVTHSPETGLLDFIIYIHNRTFGHFALK